MGHLSEKKKKRAPKWRNEERGGKVGRVISLPTKSRSPAVLLL